MRGQTMSKQQRKAIKRNRLRQLHTWGGHYSLRGMISPSHKHTASVDKEVALAAASKVVQARTEKLSMMGRILRKLGFKG